VGAGRVYLDYLRKVHEAVKARDHSMQFWGDIIVQAPRIDSGIAERRHRAGVGLRSSSSFDEHGALFAQAGLQFYVCPGTSSWNTLGGRTANALGKSAECGRDGLRHGASGYLNTEWGDNGHCRHCPSAI